MIDWAIFSRIFIDTEISARVFFIKLLCVGKKNAHTQISQSIKKNCPCNIGLLAWLINNTADWKNLNWLAKKSKQSYFFADLNFSFSFQILSIDAKSANLSL